MPWTQALTNAGSAANPAIAGNWTNIQPFTPSTRLTLACIELVEMLRAGLPPITSHLSLLANHSPPYA
jgi:hypothetical protein